MELEFDPVKDAANVAKHDISLARSADLVVYARIVDRRFGEPRFRVYGLIEGLWYCLAATRRGNALRAISLRRAHQKEIRRYVLRPDL